MAEWPEEADLLPPSSDEVKNNWIYTSTPPTCLMACVGKNLTFNLCYTVGIKIHTPVILASVLYAGTILFHYTESEHIIGAPE